MSNSFNISDAPLIAAVQAVVDANSVILIDVHDVDLPDAIARINTVDAVADAIKLKTDAMPQKVRGKWHMSYLSTDSNTYVDVVNVSGQGKLYQVRFKVLNTTTSIIIQLTLDGTDWDEFTYVGSNNEFHLGPSASTPETNVNTLRGIAILATNFPYFNFEFETSLRIQIKRGAAESANVALKAHYAVDDF